VLHQQLCCVPGIPREPYSPCSMAAQAGHRRAEKMTTRWWGRLPVEEAGQVVVRLVQLLLHLAPSVEDGAVPTRAQHILVQRTLAPLALSPQLVIICLKLRRLHADKHAIQNVGEQAIYSTRYSTSQPARCMAV
jgi:hypothetical protein